MLIYEERNEKRIGYVFYQDFGNTEYAHFLDDQPYCTSNAWSLRELSMKTKGDLLEMVMGLGYIFAKEQRAELTGIPALVNAIEDGLRAARPTEQQSEAREAANKKEHDEKLVEEQKGHEDTIKRNVIKELHKLVEKMQSNISEQF
eukprot:12970002-Heterocapsa_arctica.AAC.1